MNKSSKFLIFVSFLLIMVFVFPHKSHALTDIDSNIIEDTTWSLSGSPYIVHRSIRVLSDITLNIEPGVVVKFDARPYSYSKNDIHVNGKIIANGSESLPIYFTSSYDDHFFPETDDYQSCNYETDINGDNIGPEICVTYDLSDPSKNDWGGISISNSISGSSLKNVFMSYVYSGLEVYKSKLSVNNLNINESNDAITIYEGSDFLFSGLDISNIYHDPVTIFNDSNFMGEKLKMENFLNARRTDAIVVFNHSTLDIRDSLFKNCPNEACITVFDGDSYASNQSSISIENTIFDGGLGSGILAFSGNILMPMIIDIKDSTFKNFDLFAIENYLETTTINAKNNDWGDPTGPNHIDNPDGKGEKLYGLVSFVPWVGKEPLEPSTFYAKITNSPNGVARLYSQPSINSTLIKTLPNDWIVKVIEKKDSNGQAMIADGYIWYKVEDPTDKTLHYMFASAGTTKYLPYEKDKQTEYENNSVDNLSGTTTVDKNKRRDEFLGILDHYYNNADDKKSLYSSNDTTKISSFKEIGFQKEVILAIVGQEIAGAGFNNEIVTFDYGHGLMQVTMDALKHENTRSEYYGYKYNGDDPRGEFSKSKVEICKELSSDQYKKCYKNTETYNQLRKPYTNYNHNILNPIYKQYANTVQSMYANVKDGLGLLRKKYDAALNNSCKIGDYTVEGINFNCNDIKKVKTVWYYNGASIDPKINYMLKISDQLKVLNITFPGVIYDNSDQLIEKLAIANRHRREFKAYSPVEIRIKDSQGNITGLVNSNSVSEMPNGIYDLVNERAMILFPDDTYTYEVVGDNTGGYYGIDIDDYNNSDIPISFNARDLSITPGEIHTYSVDETKLASGAPDAVTVAIDNNGDGVTERVIKTGSQLTSVESYDFYFKKLIDGGEYKLNKKLEVKIKVTKDKGIKKIKIPKASLIITRISDGYILPLNIKDADEDDEQDVYDKEKCKKENKEHEKNYEWKIPKDSMTEGEWKVEVKLGDKVKHSIFINMVK